MQQGIVAHLKNHPLLRSLMSKIEETFFFLISKAEEKLTEEEINRIIESPDHAGNTVFSSASTRSEKISGWILDRNIDVAFVDDTWLTPQFSFESNFEKLLKKGINPFVVSYTGNTQFGLRNFGNIDQTLLQSFTTGKIEDGKTAAYYSFKNSTCNKSCQNSCEDKMIKFKLYTGKRNFENGKRGGEGFVCFGTWHQKPAAFKLLELGKIEDVNRVPDRIFNAKKNSSRIRNSFEIISSEYSQSSTFISVPRN